jgi:hypothetical protein
MADTRRTKTQILALLADNTTGDISPQDVRDWLVSSWGGYASININNGVTAQVTGGSTPVKFTGFNTTEGSNGPSNGYTPDKTGSDITIDLDGVVLITCGFAFSGTGNTEFEVYCYKNGVDTGLGFHRKLGTGGDVGSAGFTGILSVSASDYLELYIETPAGSASMTAENVQFCATQIS